jgi:hypothetical protein
MRAWSVNPLPSPKPIETLVPELSATLSIKVPCTSHLAVLRALARVRFLYALRRFSAGAFPFQPKHGFPAKYPYPLRPPNFALEIQSKNLPSDRATERRLLVEHSDSAPSIHD